MGKKKLNPLDFSSATIMENLLFYFQTWATVPFLLEQKCRRYWCWRSHPSSNSAFWCGQGTYTHEWVWTSCFFCTTWRPARRLGRKVVQVRCRIFFLNRSFRSLSFLFNCSDITNDGSPVCVHLKLWKSRELVAAKSFFFILLFFSLSRIKLIHSLYTLLFIIL